jgi:hypothetical protein
MDLVLESEILHLREYLTKRIENLSHGRYLPVEVPAADFHLKGMHLGLGRIHLHVNLTLREPEFDTVEPQVLCCVYKLQEMWNKKCELLEETNLELLKARGRDATKERFRVRANAPNCK